MARQFLVERLSDSRVLAMVVTSDGYGYPLPNFRVLGAGGFDYGHRGPAAGDLAMALIAETFGEDASEPTGRAQRHYERLRDLYLAPVPRDMKTWRIEEGLIRCLVEDWDRVQAP